MTDREMLELAAKAAELKVDREWQDQRDLVCNPDKASLCIVNGSSGWNPLRDDGDALRLAVKCGINPIQCVDSVDAMHFNSCIVETEMFEDHNRDKCAATRRAIVRAAAAIHLSKEGK